MECLLVLFRIEIPGLLHSFWQTLQDSLVTRLRMSFAYHPQTDGQFERTIQSLEDLLRTCIGIAPYEALYGRKCRTPLCWYQDGETVLVGPKLIQQTTEKVKQIQDRMKASQSRQKSYADKRRKPLEFVAGDHVFMRVTPTKGVGRAIQCLSCITAKKVYSGP